MKKRGFTLIELLVVISIIGLLASVILASVNSARSKSRDARRVSDLSQMQNALELYYSTNGSYPNLSICESVPIVGFTSWNTCWATLLSGYISAMPVDPTNSTTTYNWYSYQYGTQRNGCSPLVPGGAPGKYVLTARLENSAAANPNYCSTAFSNQIDNPAVNYILQSPN